MLRASCLKLEMNEFRCYEVKIKESKKKAAAARGYLWLERQCSATRTQDTSLLELQVLCH